MINFADSAVCAVCAKVARFTSRDTYTQWHKRADCGECGTLRGQGCGTGFGAREWAESAPSAVVAGIMGILGQG